MSNHQHTTTSSSLDSTGPVSRYTPIVLNPDGTITRVHQIPGVPASPDPTSSAAVLSKDVPLNPQHNTFLRIFLSRQALDHGSSTTKLPLVVYFHGGGFVLCSASTDIFHDFCVEMAIQVGAMIVSVDYRLAPEHRLPAAYDDAMDALHWISTSNDEWLRRFADFSNCFLMGISAGANIAYRVGLRVAAEVDDHVPLKIRGLILQQPFFGGSERTSSELRLINDQWLSLSLNDLMWELSLPIGADRDHEYCNLMVSGESNFVEQLRMLGWQVMVTGCDGDPLIDRQIELVKVLEKKCVAVIGSFHDGGYHGAQLLDSTQVKAIFAILKNFIYSSDGRL